MLFHLFSITLLCASSAISETGPRHRLGVEVWVHGSDIETPEHIATLKLRDTIEAAVSHSSVYFLAYANQGEIRVTLPDDVVLESVSNSKYAHFTADILSVKGASTRKFSGYCKADQLDTCAAEVLSVLASH